MGKQDAIVTTTIARSVDSFYGQTIDELRSRGYRVHVVTSSGPEIPRLRQRADDVHVINMARGVSLLSDLGAFVRWIILTRRIRPDVVIGGTPKAGLLSMAAAKLFGVPHRAYLLQGLRLEGSGGMHRGVLAAMERVSSWCSQRVIAVSPSLAGEYARMGLQAGRPVVVPHRGSSHGVDSQHFSPRTRDLALAEALGLNPAAPVLLYVGRLTHDKGMDTLVESLDLMGRANSSVQVLVVGAQDERDSAAYRAALAAVSQPVCLIDHTDDVRPYLTLADVLVLPTLREGLPNAVLEAAAMRIPAVTTTVTGAIDSVVHDVTGLLVPPRDAQALAAGAIRLLEDMDLRDRMGRAARERVIADFQPKDVARAIVNLAFGVDGLGCAHSDGERTVVVTGATGFIGSVLVPYLKARGHSVVTVGRTRANLSYADLSADRVVPAGAVFVHLAGKAHDLSGHDSEDDYRSSNVDLSDRVWRAALASDARHFIFMSSIKAVVDASSEAVNEGVLPQPQTPYGRSKLAAEALLASSAHGTATALTILRPAVVYGPGVKGNVRRLAQLVAWRVPYPLGSFENSRSLLSVVNLCFVVERVVSGALGPDVYHVADPDPVSTVELIELLAEGTGRRARIVRVPEPWVRGTSAVLAGSLRARIDGALTKLTDSLVVDTSKLEESLAPDRLPVETASGIRDFADHQP